MQKRSVMYRCSMLLMFSLAFSSAATTAIAGDCVLNVTRTACPGKEAESYKKCDGKQSCEEMKETSSAEACAKEALKACDNARLDITKSKVITASFDGAPVEGGKNFCEANRPDFNKCN